MCVHAEHRIAIGQKCITNQCASPHEENGLMKLEMIYKCIKICVWVTVRVQKYHFIKRREKPPLWFEKQMFFSARCVGIIMRMDSSYLIAEEGRLTRVREYGCSGHPQTDRAHVNVCFRLPMKERTIVRLEESLCAM